METDDPDCNQDRVYVKDNGLIARKANGEKSIIRMPNLATYGQLDGGQHSIKYDKLIIEYYFIFPSLCSQVTVAFGHKRSTRRQIPIISI